MSFVGTSHSNAIRVDITILLLIFSNRLPDCMTKKQISTKYYIIHSARAIPTKQFDLVGFHYLCLGGRHIHAGGGVCASPPGEDCTKQSPGALSFRRIFRQGAIF